MGGALFVRHPDMDIEAAEVHMVRTARPTYFPTDKMAAPSKALLTSTTALSLEEYDLNRRSAR